MPATCSPAGCGRLYPSVWSSFCHNQGGGGGCGPTEFYPQFNGSVQRNGSDQVASYVSSPSFGEGSIGYDEYAYALNNGIPAVKVLNSAGYYTLPTPSNVAIALQAAVIDENPNSPTFLMQNLDHVYTNPDPRTYPLSSYSYLIVPRDSRDHQRQQRRAAGPVQHPEGRDALDLDELRAVRGAAEGRRARLLAAAEEPRGRRVPADRPRARARTDAGPKQLNGCNNPTYSDGVNHLIKDAPMPSPCDKVTAPLSCTVGTTSGGGSTTGSGTTRGGTHGTSAGHGSGSTTGGGTGSGGTGTGTGTGTGATSGTGATGTGTGAAARQRASIPTPGCRWGRPAAGRPDRTPRPSAPSRCRSTKPTQRSELAAGDR